MYVSWYVLHGFNVPAKDPKMYENFVCHLKKCQNMYIKKQNIYTQSIIYTFIHICYIYIYIYNMCLNMCIYIYIYICMYYIVTYIIDNMYIYKTF